MTGVFWLEEGCEIGLGQRFSSRINGRGKRAVGKTMGEE